MPFISGISDEMVVADIFNWSPDAGRCISEWHEIVMRGKSPLSTAQREFIAAYVSALNACALCSGVHELIAERFGIPSGTMQEAFDSVEQSSVEDKLKPLLSYAKKLTESPAKMVLADATAVFDAGWDEQALHDAINVTCMFNFMNRIVMGHGGTEGDIEPHFGASADFLASSGYTAEGAP